MDCKFDRVVFVSQNSSSAFSAKRRTGENCSALHLHRFNIICSESWWAMCIGVRPASTTLVSAADSESQSCKSSLSAALRSVCAALRPMNELSVCCCALFSVVYPRRPRVVAKPKCSRLKLESIRSLHAVGYTAVRRHTGFAARNEENSLIQYRQLSRQ